MPHLLHAFPHFGPTKKSVLHGFELVPGFFGGGLEKNEKGHKPAPTPTGPSMKLQIESPPLVCYGPPRESTGALLSGQICLQIGKEQECSKLSMSLLVDVVGKQPVMYGCKECTEVTTELHQWNMITEPTKLTEGEHLFPFSYLFPGHLPATTNTPLSMINYRLSATGITTDGEEIYLKNPSNGSRDYPLVLRRSILPGPDRHSIRIFPPTNLSASVTLPSVVHPGGDFCFDIRLDGIVNTARGTQWRLRKAAWRIEESCRAVSPACKRHTKKLGGDGKGILHEDTRIVGSGEVRGGWKSDFSPESGKIEMDMTAAMNPETSCDVDTPTGISVAHILVVEMIVAEEYVRRRDQRTISPTGAARVLRMQFNLCVTDRAGLGISWDEEAPPTYDDVPQPPPSYEGIQMETYTACPIEYVHSVSGDGDTDDVDHHNTDN